MYSGRESTGFAACRQGAATGREEGSFGGDHAVAVGEMSALTNELERRTSLSLLPLITFEGLLAQSRLVQPKL